MNAVEREPVETTVFNPNASEASYKPKQRSYRKVNLNKILAPDSPGAQMSGTKMSSAQTAALKRTRPIYIYGYIFLTICDPAPPYLILLALCIKNNNR